MGVLNSYLTSYSQREVRSKFANLAVFSEEIIIEYRTNVGRTIMAVLGMISGLFSMTTVYLTVAVVVIFFM